MRHAGGYSRSQPQRSPAHLRPAIAALQAEEPLIFEIGRYRHDRRRSAGAESRRPSSASSTHASRIGLPGLSEPETMRHFVRLSQKNYAIDSASFRSARAR